MKTHLALTILGAALLSVPNAFGQTPPPAATSGVVGFSNISCPAGTTLIVPTLVNSSVFQGQAAISSDGLTITPTTAPSWTSSAYSKTTFAGGVPNYPKYYAEVVTAGANEGQIFDIDTNSTTALTLISAVPSTLGLRGTTVQVVVREHMTLDKMIQGATGLTAFADAVSIFNPNGTQSGRNFDGTTWLDESFVNSVGHTVIYPGTGLVFTASGPVTFTMMGEVKPTKTKVPMYAGTTNIVGPVNPASSTPLYGNSIATALAAYADGVNSFSTTGDMAIVGSYASDGTNVLDGSFNPLASNAPDAIPLNRGVVVTVGTDTVWTINSPLAP
jgi:hypothetical protein